MLLSNVWTCSKIMTTRSYFLHFFKGALKDQICAIWSCCTFEIKICTLLLETLTVVWQKVGHKGSLSSWCKPREEKWSKVHKATFGKKWSKYPYYVVSLHADFQTSSMCCNISHDYVGWKLELWGKKNDQKDTSKDRIGLCYSVPLLADQNSKYDISFFNLARIGQYCILLIWISTWVDKKWSNGHMNFFRNWGKHKISLFFTISLG